MALLYYQNIVEREPNVVMRNAVFGLKIFYDFLKRTKKFVESDYSVMPLGWKPGYCPFDENAERHAEGCWIKLIEPLGRLNDSDAVFCDYFDEKVKEIYEQTPEEYREFITNKPPFREVIDWKKQIKIIDRDPQTQQLCLERQPDESSLLTLRPNTRTINCQLNALRMLQDKPQRHHLPLLQLFERPDPKIWEEFIPASIKEKDWLVLTDAKRDGTDEQRRFVKIALNTPDFALLEGPPGSGKTTAICELILQLAKLGKRVLLCGSTHIAVDNVLERLMDRDNLHRDTVIPVRIGDRRSVSEKALPWQIDEFMKTERERILRNLNQVKNPTESQSEFKYLLEQENNVIERMVLETANLVCGTPIGILQHPDIKKQNKNKHSSIPKFDFLIFDEASKTPFQEFLVPALWAKRWIIVGDPKQLSPYVDENAMEINIEACLPNEDVRNACVDTFLVRKPNQPHTAAVATTSNETKLAYLEQCDKHNIKIADADQENCTNLWAASIVIGEEKSLSKWADKLPLDITTVRCPDNALFTIKRRSDAWQRLAGQSEPEQPKWASEVGWRTVRLYELRLIEKPKTQGVNRDNKKKSTSKRLGRERKDLLPVSNKKKCLNEIETVGRVALPSILESLQNGIGKNEGQKKATALSNGLPKLVRKHRHLLLSTQHRMHPEIAEFSHEHIYDRKALKTPDSMKYERDWSYSRYSHRTIWIHVPAYPYFSDNSNTAEAKIVVEELSHFDEWAKINRRYRSDTPWEVAVLTFYRSQEQEIRNHLQEWTNLPTMRHFYRETKGRRYLTIELCTVDRFQGHEADFVLNSFVNRRATSFLQSPNRLNVALTRARYQRVAIGDRKAMAKGDSDGVLHRLAENEHWHQVI